MAKILHHSVGDLWAEPVATFTVAGVNTDPTNLTVRLQDAAGVETVLVNNVLVSTLNAGSTPIKKTGTGVFQPSPGVSLPASGHYFLKFEGTGAAAATIQWETIVDPDEFTLDAGIASWA